MFCKRTTVSVIFILLIAEVFHHCSAQNDTKLPSISVGQPPAGLGLGSMISSMPLEKLNPSMLMEQLLSIIKMLNQSVSQMREAMGLDENEQSEDQ